MFSQQLETDYLIIGAGAMGLAFVDTIRQQIRRDTVLGCLFNCAY